MNLQKSLLQKRGIIRTEDKEIHSLYNQSNVLTVLNQINLNGKFCIKCKMVLSYDSYNETIEEKRRKENEILKIKSDYENDMKRLREDMENKFQILLSKIELSKLV